MDFKFKDKDLSLLPNSTTEQHGIIKTYLRDGFNINEYKQIRGSQKNSAVLAFYLVAKIANKALGVDCAPSDFTLPRGGHMVQFRGYDSWGPEPETSKRRVKSNNFNDVASVEFYVRHALLVLEYESNGVKRQTQKRCACV